MILRKRRSTPGTYLTVNSCNSNIEPNAKMERNGGNSCSFHSIQPCLSASLSLFIIQSSSSSPPPPHPEPHHSSTHINCINHLLSSSFLLHQIKTPKNKSLPFPLLLIFSITKPATTTSQPRLPPIIIIIIIILLLTAFFYFLLFFTLVLFLK